ncbi:MAG: energy transducer TonB [Cyclobacteriaceae bacterium]
MDDRKNDIAKYLKGELSPAEMHKLEMQALHDPFLADALEGAEIITPEQFSEDVISLNKKVNTKSAKKNYWPLRLAASILLIISITYLIFQVKPENTNESLALNKEEKNTESKTEEVTIEETDSVEKIKDNTEERRKNNLALKSEDKPITKPKAVPREIIEDSESPEPTSEPLEEAISLAPQVEEEATSEDASSSKQDLMILENEKVSGFKTESGRVRSDALKKSAPASTLSGAGSKEMESSPTVFTTASPIIGHEEYQNYLKENIQYPKEAIDNKVSGDVVVSFLVDINGSLSSFSIDKDIGFGCAQELIRLIQGGPKWIPAQHDGALMKEKVSLKFNFELPN